MTFLAVRALAAVARHAPRRALELATDWLLRFGLLWPASRRRPLLSNYRRILRAAGSEPSETELEAVLARSMRAYRDLLIGILAREDDVAFAREKVDLDLWPLWQRARAEGRGAVFAFSYFGRFSHALMALLLREVPLLIPVADPALAAHLPRGWSRSFVGVGDSARECLRMLKAGGAVAVLPMLNFLPKRLEVPFFGAPARIGYAAAELSVLSGAPILPAFTLEDGGRLRVVSGGAIEPRTGPDALARTNAALVRQQEHYIARRPELWHVYEDVWDLEGMDRSYRLLRRLL